MSGPVDVLAVMDADGRAVALVADGCDPVGLRRKQWESHLKRHDEARAAVAELVEREKAQREALESCERWFEKHSPTAPLINGLGVAEHPMLTMIRAALARVQGGAA